jgi:hypothetical protein
VRYQAIRRIVDRKPWRPLTFVLASGERVRVTHREDMLVHREIIVLVANGELYFSEPGEVNAVIRRRRNAKA